MLWKVLDHFSGLKIRFVDFKLMVFFIVVSNKSFKKQRSFRCSCCEFVNNNETFQKIGNGKKRENFSVKKVSFLQN